MYSHALRTPRLGLSLKWNDFRNDSLVDSLQTLKYCLQPQAKENWCVDAYNSRSSDLKVGGQTDRWSDGDVVERLAAIFISHRKYVLR